MGANDLDVKVMGFYSVFGNLCDSTAPGPYSEASQTRIILLVMQVIVN